MKAVSCTGHRKSMKFTPEEPPARPQRVRRLKHLPCHPSRAFQLLIFASPENKVIIGIPELEFAIGRALQDVRYATPFDDRVTQLVCEAAERNLVATTKPSLGASERDLGGLTKTPHAGMVVSDEEGALMKMASSGVMARGVQRWVRMTTTTSRMTTRRPSKPLGLLGPCRRPTGHLRFQSRA